MLDKLVTDPLILSNPDKITTSLKVSVSITSTLGASINLVKLELTLYSSPSIAGKVSVLPDNLVIALSK